MLLLTPNGKYRFWGRDVDEDDEAVVAESWVENVYEIHEGLFGDSNVMIDIGANIGATSIFAASLSDDWEDKQKIKVLAYEPEPHNIDYLYENIKTNGKEDQVKVFKYAIGGRREMVYINDGSGSSQIGADEITGQKVEQIRLEDIYADNKVANCDLLKIDVEGSEYDIILNTPDDILKKAAHIRIEFHAYGKGRDFGKMIDKLCRNFNVHIVGKPDVGGNIYADRY